jgi:hypothetical protein
MKARALLAILVVVFAVAAAPAQARGANAVGPWIDLELRSIAAHATNPARASRALAHVSVAVDLAARAGGRPCRRGGGGRGLDGARLLLSR